MTVAIEPMTEADLDAVLDIDVAAFGEPREVRERSLREELARAWARIHVARVDGGRIVGYLLYWHVVDEGHVINVAVEPRERRHGIGRALVAHLVEHARANGIVKLLLEVRASNVAAIGLYEKAGFTKFNVRERYYGDGEDAVEMMVPLSPSP
jgi:[ribosomal protein S18]-alanine N-acetyltransferase